MELILLEMRQGRVIKRFPYKSDSEDEIAKLRNWGKGSLDFTEDWALDVRHDLLKSLFSGESPAPLDIAQWTADDVRRIDKIFSSGDSERLMRQGAIKGRFLFPNADDVVVLDAKRHLTYRASSGDSIRWRYICTAGTRDTLLWQPPYIVVFSARTVVTAYQIKDGSPAWMYEFPADTSNGGPVYRLAALSDGILLVTEPLRGTSENDYLSLTQSDQESLRQKKSPYLWLTKLDFSGKRLFQQELTLKSSYQKLALSRGFLLLWNGDTLVCYGPTDVTPKTTPSDTLPPLSEEQRNQEIERLHAEYDRLGTYTYDRRFVCLKLGRLHDRSMLQRVLADFETASDNQRSHYVDMLSYLNDRRAIDKLVPLLQDKSPTFRLNIMRSLASLTGLGPTIMLPADWEEWWNRHKALFRE